MSLQRVIADKNCRRIRLGAQFTTLRYDGANEAVNQRMGRPAQAGFTLVEIMIVVAIIGLLAAIAVPNFVRARTNSQMNACINNLIQIDDAKQQWALDTRQATNGIPQFSDISGYMKSAVTCPAGGSSATFATSYIIRNVAGQPRCIILPTNHVSPRG